MAAPLHNVRVVIGSIGDDIHVVGITILGHALRNAGAEVIQLGIQTPAAEFVATAVAEDVDVVMVSSSNGHASLWCDSLRADLNAAGADGVLLYVGGNLANSAATTWESVEAKFLAMGFNRVFGPRTQPAEAIRLLAQDLRRDAETEEVSHA
jgi:methylaspartate mutase sigma subunit